MNLSRLLGLFACALGLGVAPGLWACRGADRRDELILTRAEKPLGQLSDCDEAGCTLDGSKFAHSAIAWIGLGTGEAPPPAVQHADSDEEHLRDGSVQRGRLLRIDSATVVTDAGSYERSQVAFVHLAGAIAGAAQAASPTGAIRPEYQWDGTIEVSTACRSKIGASDWRAEYHVTFREVPQHDSTPEGSRVHPIQVRYAYHAGTDLDQDIDTPPGDVHLHGDASGVVSAFDRHGIAPGLTFRGDIMRLDAPQPHVAVPASFATWQDLVAFFSEPQTHRPGYYEMWIGTAGSPVDKRDLYQGILLTGGAIHKFSGPDADALDLVGEIPAYMPLGTTLRGFLEDPDQRQVSGAYSFDDAVDCGTTAIAIRWTFTRTRLEIDLDSAGPAVATCGADLASLDHKMKEACDAAMPHCERSPGDCDTSQLKRLSQRCQDRVSDYQKASAACTPAL